MRLLYDTSAHRKFHYDGENAFKIGFKKMRQKGAHVFYKHPDGRTTTVPNHAGRDLARPLTHVILREIELSHDEFIKLLTEI